jgi:hypothetical protein
VVVYSVCLSLLLGLWFVFGGAGGGSLVTVYFWVFRVFC